MRSASRCTIWATRAISEHTIHALNAAMVMRRQHLSNHVVRPSISAFNWEAIRTTGTARRTLPARGPPGLHPLRAMRHVVAQAITCRREPAQMQRSIMTSQEPSLALEALPTRGPHGARGAHARAVGLDRKLAREHAVAAHVAHALGVPRARSHARSAYRTLGRPGVHLAPVKAAVLARRIRLERALAIAVRRARDPTRIRRTARLVRLAHGPRGARGAHARHHAALGR